MTFFYLSFPICIAISYILYEVVLTSDISIHGGLFTIFVL